MNKLLIAILLLPGLMQAQSNPTPQAIPFILDFGTTGFTTMPPGTASWNGLSGAVISTQALAESSIPTGDAGLSSRTTKSTTGGTYGFHNNGNARLYIQSSLNSSNGVNQFIVAVNTGNFTELNLSYDIEMVNEGAGRDMGVIVQFRKTSSSSWTSLGASTVVYDNTSMNMGDDDNEGDVDSYSFTITSLSANTDYQLRWAVWRGTESGASTGLAFDNIDISGSGPCSPPTTQSSNFQSNDQTDSSIDFDFERGNGTGGVLVVVKEGSAVNATPQNNTSYSASFDFGDGSEIGVGNYVVYNGSANGVGANSGSMTLSALAGSTVYHFAIFEYGGGTGNECYLTPALTGNQETKCTAPANQSESLFLSQYVVSMEVGFTEAPGSPAPSGYLVVRSTNANPTCNPVDGTFYSVGDIIDDCEVASVGNVRDFMDTGLSPSTTYYYLVFSYFGGGNNVCPNYLNAAPLNGTATTNPMPAVTINEVDSDTPGSDNAEFIELSGPAFTDLDGLVMVLYNGNNDETYTAIDLDGYSLNAQGFFVYCSDQGNVANCDAAGAPGFLQNGADAVALYAGEAAEFTNGTVVTAANLIDAVVYDNGQADDAGLLAGLGQADQYNEDQLGNGTSVSLQLMGNWGVGSPTPGLPNALLPIELTAFEGFAKNNRVELFWETALEINNDFFSVQHSLDGFSFFEIGRKDGAGDAYTSNQYEYFHSQPFAGDNFYRLVQFDLDGKKSVSPVIKVAMKDESLILVYPTLVKNDLNIVLNKMPEQEVEYFVLNKMGQISNQGKFNPENKSFTINLNSINTGVYFLKLKNGQKISMHKFIRL
ncbi:MAG: T9SS type A sorting domain-containing protein [Bacteroidota bacterium]